MVRLQLNHIVLNTSVSLNIFAPSLTKKPRHNLGFFKNDTNSQYRFISEHAHPFVGMEYLDPV